MVIGAFRLSVQSVRKAVFYEDHFIVRGGKSTRRIDYSQVEKVSLIHESMAKVFPVWTLRTQINVHLTGETKPLIIPTNPKSWTRKKDLYSWLEARASARAANEIPSSN